MYGNAYGRGDTKYLHSKYLPLILSKLTVMFNFKLTKYLNSMIHSSCARVVMQKEFGIVHSFTLESSFYGYNKNDGNCEFESKDYEQLGKNLGVALAAFAIYPITRVTTIE